MKKIILLAICLCILATTFACEFCGCSSGNYFIGPLPVFQKHFAGIRYTLRSFNTQLKNDPTQFSKDFYQTAELWSGWNINKKWMLLVFVPYNVNRQNSDDGKKINSGLGDVSAILNYNIFTHSKMYASGRMLRQQLFLGGGLKLPTGKFEADANALVPSANNQAGTGSLDFIVTGTYALNYDRLGISTNLTYKINQRAQEFRFGNRLFSNLFVSYALPASKVIFTPNAGLLYEKLQSNVANNIKIPDTGGHALMAATGLEVNFNKISLGANIQLPVNENISAGQTHTRANAMIHVTLVF